MKTVTYHRPVEASLHLAFENGDMQPAGEEDLVKFGYYPPVESPAWMEVEVDLASGSNIETAVRQMIVLATLAQAPVRSVFNGYRFKVTSGDLASDVVKAYWNDRRATE